MFIKFIIPLIVFLFPPVATDVVVAEHSWKAVAEIQCYYKPFDPFINYEGCWIDSGQQIEEGEGKIVDPDFDLVVYDPYCGLTSGDEKIKFVSYVYKILIHIPKTGKQYWLRVNKKTWKSLKKGEKLKASMMAGAIIELKRLNKDK